MSELPPSPPAPETDSAVRADEDPRWARRSRLVGWLALLGVLGGCGWLGWQSRDWPLVQDPPLMHYLALRIEAGDVPYRDQIDMNLPGAYVFHLLVIKTLGPGDRAWRTFDLLWLAGTCGLIALFCRRSGAIAALGAAAIFALFHLNEGVLRMGQRDYFLFAICLAGAICTCRFCRVRKGAGWLILAGLLAGIGITLKPFVGLWWLFLAGMAGGCAPAGKGPRIRAAGMVLLGGAIPLAAMFVWLWRAGAMPAFFDVLLHYTLPLYGQTGRLMNVELVRRIVRNRFFVAMAAVAGVAVLAALRRRGRLRVDQTILLGGVAYGLLHYYLQGKGWSYHQYPLIGFTCLLAVTGRTRRKPHAPAPVAPATLAALAAALILAGYSVWSYHDNVTPKKRAYMDTLVADIGEHLSPGDTVQVLDATAGGVNALARLGVHQPTSFIYDFHFYHHMDHPYIQGMRKRFLTEIQAAPPKVIVYFKDVWPNTGSEPRRIEQFPEFKTWLETNYRVARTRDEYRIREDLVSRYVVYVRRTPTTRDSH